MNYFIDTGPLVAYLDKQDHYHYWAGKTLADIEPPLLTCEAVLTETLFLLQRQNKDFNQLFQLIDRGDLVISSVFTASENQAYIRTMMDTYADLPASFADVCLLRMYETIGNPRYSKIITLDSDFSIYRDKNNEPFSLISPL